MNMEKYINICKRIKIYKVACTKGYQLAECQSNFSLSPWGNNTVYYEGHDDGGMFYDLPEGFELGETEDGTSAIYRGTEHYSLSTCFGRPTITNGVETFVLSLSIIQSL